MTISKRAAGCDNAVCISPVVVDNLANPFTLGSDGGKWICLLGVGLRPVSVAQNLGARTVQRLRSDAIRRRLVRGISSQLRGGPLVRCTSASAMKQWTWTHEIKQPHTNS